MNYSVRLVGWDRTFPADPEETLLEAALRAGIPVRYGCRRGKCSTCKHYVLEGQVDDSRVSAYALLDEERDDGVTLLCQSYPRSDCVIEPFDHDQMS